MSFKILRTQPTSIRKAGFSSLYIGDRWDPKPARCRFGQSWSTWTFSMMARLQMPGGHGMVRPWVICASSLLFVSSLMLIVHKFTPNATNLLSQSDLKRRAQRPPTVCWCYPFLHHHLLKLRRLWVLRTELVLMCLSRYAVWMITVFPRQRVKDMWGWWVHQLYGEIRKVSRSVSESMPVDVWGQPIATMTRITDRRDGTIDGHCFTVSCRTISSSFPFVNCKVLFLFNSIEEMNFKSLQQRLILLNPLRRLWSALRASGCSL